MTEDDKTARLQRAVQTLASWVGCDTSDLIEDGLIEEGDIE